MPNVPNPACGVIQAARMLGLSRAAIRHRMSRYGITRPQVAPHPGLPGVEDGAGSLRAEALSLESTQEPSRVSAASWEQKPVAVLAIELTSPAISGGDASPYEPWTAARRWERIILEKVHGFGGVCLQRSPSLLLVAFGLPQTVEQLPQCAVQRERAPVSARARPSARAVSDWGHRQRRSGHREGAPDPAFGGLGPRGGDAVSPAAAWGADGDGPTGDAPARDDQSTDVRHPSAALSPQQPAPPTGARHRELALDRSNLSGLLGITGRAAGGYAHLPPPHLSAGVSAALDREILCHPDGVAAPLAGRQPTPAAGGSADGYHPRRADGAGARQRAGQPLLSSRDRPGTRGSGCAGTARCGGDDRLDSPPHDTAH